MHVLVLERMFLQFLSIWRVFDTFFLLESLGDNEKEEYRCNAVFVH